MKPWSIDWCGFSWEIDAYRTDYIPDEYGTYGDFFLIYILGLHIILDLQTNRKHEEIMKLIEVLADIEHKRWSHWQEYLHSKCAKDKNGNLVIPKESVKNLERLINTPYAKLTEDEKESDREEAKKFLWDLKKNKYFFKRRK